MCEHLKIFGKDHKECEHTMHPTVPKCIICPECGDVIPWEFQKDILLRILRERERKENKNE